LISEVTADVVTTLAGHHLILDDPAGFSAAVERWLADTRKEDLK